MYDHVDHVGHHLLACKDDGFPGRGSGVVAECCSALEGIIAFIREVPDVPFELIALSS